MTSGSRACNFCSTARAWALRTPARPTRGPGTRRRRPTAHTHCRRDPATQPAIRESAARFRSRSPTSPRRQPPDSVAAWGFDEASGATAADASGNGNTATLVNGPTRVDAKYGKGVSFDQVNDYLTVRQLELAGHHRQRAHNFDVDQTRFDHRRRSRAGEVLERHHDEPLLPVRDRALRAAGRTWASARRAALVTAGADAPLALNQWTRRRDLLRRFSGAFLCQRCACEQ